MGSVITTVPDIPTETFQAARKVFHLDHIYLFIGDHLGEILANVSMPDLDPTTSMGDSMTSRLALVTAFQYAERIPDTLAEQATFERMDWKYALHLPIQHPGYAAAVLCQFRLDLFSSSRALQELSSLLRQLGEAGLYAKEVVKSLDPNEALTTVCLISKLYLQKEAMKSALSLLVTTDPNWLRANALPHWYSRYQTGRLGMLAELDNRAVIGEIEAIEADLYYILKHVCQMQCSDPYTQPVIESLRTLFGKLEQKMLSSNEGSSGCENSVSRNKGYFSIP